MFSSTTTELSINRENASAKPPKIMLLIELPASARTMNVARAERGIEKRTASVARKLPRKIRIISEVRNRPMPPSSSNVSMAVLTNFDWSNTTRLDNAFGTSTSFLSASRMPSTTAIVLESPPCFRIGKYTDRWPSTRTILV